MPSALLETLIDYLIVSHGNTTTTVTNLREPSNRGSSPISVGNETGPIPDRYMLVSGGMDNKHYGAGFTPGPSVP